MRIEHLERGHHVGGGVEHVEDGDVRAGERLREHEGQLDFDAHVGEAVELDHRSRLEHHVVVDDPVVGFGDAGRELHHLGGEADLVADEPAAPLLEPAIRPELLDGVRILDDHLGIALGEPGEDRAFAIRLNQLVSDRFDLLLFEHAASVSAAIGAAALAARERGVGAEAVLKSYTIRGARAKRAGKRTSADRMARARRCARRCARCGVRCGCARGRGGAPGPCARPAGAYGSRRFGPRNRYVVSRIDGWPSISISTRLRPMPKPPWGGMP